MEENGHWTGRWQWWEGWYTHEEFELEWEDSSLRFYHNGHVQTAELLADDGDSCHGFAITCDWSDEGECRHEFQMQDEDTFSCTCGPGSWHGVMAFGREKLQPVEGLPDGADAYLTDDLEESFQAFHKNGFLILPHGTVPDNILEAARESVEDNNSGSSCESEIFDLIRSAPIAELLMKLLGDDPNPAESFGGWAQVAKIPPLEEIPGVRTPAVPPSGEWFPRGGHIDLGHNDERADRFSLLVGVPLTSTEETFMGNFGVFPGSHQKVADTIGDHGGYSEVWKAGPKKGPAGTAHWNVLRWLPVERMCPLPLQVEPGQAYIAHFNTVHWMQPNVRGPTRTVIYFRVGHPKFWTAGKGDPEKYDEDALVNLWRDFPPFGGEWEA